ncbi:uncharacterized protein LOC121876630 isoform X1 [Homarus americanus]|uniref:Uncharacterized protein n=1 Tax=Homarus americanus TaxID=6706 RepID=A0A8J5JKC2_HOMAM|nr:uncharacterized protein LOC121876630 isoform X1 [Homarus americanus]XP_042237843.1 uncharacterized protein LOC121876630 isoform X1 [Homarus americanus]KAG7160097.1 hypothetical protein Hamer_G012635 [Homarus americanus]
MTGGRCVMVAVAVCVLVLTSPASSGQYQLSRTSTDDHLHRVLREVAEKQQPVEVPPHTEQQERRFPYIFDEVAAVAQKRRKVAVGAPYTLVKKQLESSGHYEHTVNTAEAINLPTVDKLAQAQKRRPQGQWPFRSLSKTELDFIGIMAAIIVKLVMSTALATWFMAAGQVLYGIASFTSGTSIFGMDSAIKFIYLTVPFVEALMRGDTAFTQ